MSIFFIVIIASNARLAAAGSGSVIAFVRATGVICQDRPHLSLHQPQALSCAAVADDRVPVAVRLGLVGGRDLERERLVVLERRPAVEAEARDAQHGELDGQHVPLLPRREVARRAVHRADGRVGKRLGVKPRRLLGVAVVPEADRVLCWGWSCHSSVDVVGKSCQERHEAKGAKRCRPNSLPSHSWRRPAARLFIPRRVACQSCRTAAHG